MRSHQQRYNPAFLTKEQIPESFSVHQNTLHKLLKFVSEEALDKPRKHMILVGLQGMGKSTLGLRLLNEIETDGDLSKIWTSVPFNAESYEIADAADFWLTALRQLSYVTGDPDWAKRASALAEQESDNQRVEAYAIAMLDEYCTESMKRLILFVENIDTVLDQLKSKREVHALRATFMTNKNFLVLGSSESLFSGILEYSAPFYGFFRVIRLRGLDREQTDVLAHAIAKRLDPLNADKILSRERGRIETIRRLTGGNLRLITQACQISCEQPPTTTPDCIERLIDGQSLYFKARMEELPAQARKVFVKLAEGWRPMLSSEVARRTRLGSSQTSAQLKVLVDRGYVSKVHRNKEKRTRYEVSDRFFNIYCLYRFTPPTRDRIEYLVAFLCDLFDPPTVQKMYLVASDDINCESHCDANAIELLKHLGQHIFRKTKLNEDKTWVREMSELFQTKMDNPHPNNGHSTDILYWRNLARNFRTKNCRNAAPLACIHALESIISGLLSYKRCEREYALTSLEADTPIDSLVKEIREMLDEAEYDDLNECKMFLGSIGLAIGKIRLLLKQREKAAISIQESIIHTKGACEINNEDTRGLLLRLHLSLIPLLDELNFEDELIDVVTNALKLSQPNDKFLHERLIAGIVEACGMLIKFERYPELEELCTEITKKFPDIDAGWRLFAICVACRRAETGMVEARKYVDKAVLLNPNNVWNHYSNFVVASSMGDWEKGIERLEHCLNAKPDAFQCKLSRIASILIEAIRAGKGRKVKSVIESVEINKELEPLWHALRDHLGEDLEPLPREINDAVEHIGQRIGVCGSSLQYA